MNWLRREWHWFWHTDEFLAERFLRWWLKRGRPSRRNACAERGIGDHDCTEHGEGA